MNKLNRKLFGGVSLHASYLSSITNKSHHIGME